MQELKVVHYGGAVVDNWSVEWSAVAAHQLVKEIAATAGPCAPPPIDYFTSMVIFSDITGGS